MRATALGIFFVLAACGDSTPPPVTPGAPPAASPPSAAAPSRTEKLTAETPKATAEGATFIAPAGWSFTVRGAATLLEPPEGDSHIAFVDVRAKDADAAVAA